MDIHQRSGDHDVRKSNPVSWRHESPALSKWNLGVQGEQMEMKYRGMTKDWVTMVKVLFHDRKCHNESHYITQLM